MKSACSFQDGHQRLRLSTKFDPIERLRDRIAEAEGSEQPVDTVVLATTRARLALLVTAELDSMVSMMEDLQEAMLDFRRRSGRVGRQTRRQRMPTRHTA